MSALDIQGIAVDLGLALLHSLWQVALVALALWGFLTLLHRASPNVRYHLALAALAAALLWPATTFRQARIDRSTRSAAIARGPKFIEPAILLPSPPQKQTPIPARIITWTRPALPWLALLWGAGVIVLGLRLMGGWWWLQRLRQSAQPAPEWVLNLGADLARRMGLRLPSLRVADGISGPFGYGLWRTIVVLPAACLGHMDVRDLEALLAHEFAHLRRHDFLVNALQALAELLLFHHPIAHWISAIVRLERERCCDLAAVAICGDAIFYAAVLDRLDDLRPATGNSLQLAPFGRTSLALRAQGAPLMTRIRHLLGVSARPSLPALLSAALVLTGLGLAAAIPFHDGAPSPAILVPADLLKQVDAAAIAEGIDPDLMRAMIQCESRYNPKAKSPYGSMGLMQLMPKTAARFGATDPWQVDQNLKAGAKYLRFLLDRYQGDTSRAVMAYNAGETAVDASGSVAPHEESRLYVKAVMNLYREKAIQATEGNIGLQTLQGRLSHQEDDSWKLQLEGWVMGKTKAEITQPSASPNAEPTRVLGAANEESPFYYRPTCRLVLSPGDGPIHIAFEDLNSHRKGEATVPVAAGDFMLELKR